MGVPGLSGRAAVVILISGGWLAATASVSTAQQFDPFDPLPEACARADAVTFEGTSWLSWQPERSRFTANLVAADLTIEPGRTYTVSLVSYDNHSEKVRQAQLAESWLVELSVDGGEPAYSSPPTPDLPEDVDVAENIVDTAAVVDSAVDTITAVHAYEGIEQATSESIWPVCAVFEQQPLPPPVVVVEKATNGADADDPFGDDVPVVAPGSDVTWTYVVTNEGGSAVGGVVVTDDRLGVVSGPVSGDGNGDGLLDPGEVWEYSVTGEAVDLSVAEGAVPGCVAGGGEDDVEPSRPAYRNVVTVSTDDKSVSATDVSHYCNPPPPARLAVLLTDTVVDRDGLAAGAEFSYVVIVANVGGEPTQPTDLQLRWLRDDGSKVSVIGAQSRSGPCGVSGTDVSVPALRRSEVIECPIATRVESSAATTVVAQVWEGDIRHDEEPILLVPEELAVPPIAAVLGAVDLAPIEIAPVVVAAAPDTGGAPAAAAAPAAPSTTTAAALPRTGGEHWTLASVAVVLVVAGLLLVAVEARASGRLRRRSPDESPRYG